MDPIITNKPDTKRTDQTEINEQVEKKKYFVECPKSSLQQTEPIHVQAFKTTSRKEIFLHLFSNMIVKSVEKNLSTSAEDTVEILMFTSDLAFYVRKIDDPQKRHSAIKFVNMKDSHQSQTFYTLSAKVVSCWQSLLANYVNQIGIQEYFRTTRVLGKGVSAQVFLAERITDGKLFAVKVFNKVKNNKKCQDAFENEIKTLRILNHPNIMKLYNVFVSNEYIYAVLQYLSGGTLFEEVKQLQNEKKKYPPEQEIQIAKNLVSAIEHLRIKRIVHRDLKLENILIRPASGNMEKAYVLCDFGLATWVDEESYIFQKCGTPGYIAPEILRAPKGERIPIDCKVDIFSLGCILHVVFLIRTVFHYSGDCKQLLKQNKQCQIDFSARRYEGAKRSQLELLECMLEKDPRDRPSSDILLKMDYFRQQRSSSKDKSTNETQRSSQHELSRVPMTIIRSSDRMGSVQVRDEKKTTFTRNASLNKNISFTEQKEKPTPKQKSSSFLDFFTRKKVNNDNSSKQLVTEFPARLKIKQPISLKKEMMREMLSNQL